MSVVKPRRPQDLTQYSLRQLRRVQKDIQAWRKTHQSALTVLDLRVKELGKDQINLAQAIRNLERRMSARGLS